jgi:hypothetical protein
VLPFEVVCERLSIFSVTQTRRVLSRYGPSSAITLQSRWEPQFNDGTPHIVLPITTLVPAMMANRALEQERTYRNMADINDGWSTTS